ncbi:Peptidyl-prolyl cis-trans isomerase fkbp19, chloroplastic [Coccomyxa viridis]|uniref:peptidylprolyl isomerase n=1 Tax=Coccomyxa viridis TaxID=1274662 RepID=A0AAV1HWZ7_9CHLO|nr:Peptidyl-prolyl cis-trans isomerase fkbp19, chloroplastic [Coccomyxa viridis]
MPQTSQLLGGVPECRCNQVFGQRHITGRNQSARKYHVRCNAAEERISCSRRALGAAGAAGAVLMLLPQAAQALIKGYEPMTALKGKDYGKERQRYSDYTRTESGLQYQDLREGTGKSAKAGAQVTIDWDGYTIGYYGRPFEARNKAKGGSFAKDKDFYRFTLGRGEVIPAVEEAVASMKEGGIRRIVVPVELGYPNNDMNAQGPTPTTFSGQRALDFVLRNQGLIDKTLLIDIELVKVS